MNKIYKNTFLISTLILLIGGIFGKIVGFIIKIIITRNLGVETMGLYSLLSPTISLLSTIAVFSYPTIISRQISNKQYRTKDLFSSIIPISILINSIIIFIVVLLSKFITTTLLKESSLYLPLICVSLTMPFISISSIIKGFYWGKQNMFPYMLSNFIEQITRIILIVLFLDKIKNNIYKICFVILMNIIGELVSQIIMYLYLPKTKINNLSIDTLIIKDTIPNSFRMTTSKLIGVFSHFLEPIILTNILLYVGYNKEIIVFEYGIINAYVIPLLLMSQFFTQNMSTSLIPEISANYKINNKLCIKRIKQVCLISSLIGLSSTIVITIFPKFFLNLLYKTTEGIDYIKLLSPFMLLFYIQFPLATAINAIGNTKDIIKITVFSSISKIISIIILSLLKIGMYSLIISIIINLVITTYMYYKELNKLLIN